MKKQPFHRLSIKQWVILTLVLGFTAMACTIIIDITYSIRQLKSETSAQYLSILDMQRESLDTNIGKAAAVLLSYKMNGKHINELINANDRNSAYFAVTNVTSDLESQILNSTISEIVYAYKSGLNRSGVALSSNRHFSSEEKLAVKEYVESLDMETAGTHYTWKPCLIGNEWYFVYNIADRDYVIGQGIRVKTIASLFQLKLDTNSGIAVLNNQGEDMISSAAARKNSQLLNNRTQKRSSATIYEDLIIVYTYSNNLCRPIFFIKDGLLSENFQNIIYFLWGTVFLVIVICILVFVNISRAILRPVKALHNCLGRVRDGDLTAKIHVDPNVPREFLDVYNTLNEMTSRIHELKIESYESELKRSHYELQFLSIQIEPHFYLNSMKYIYALAQTKQYETLKSMILNLANCFRYLTYGSEETVPLQKELKHVEHYLSIINSGSPSHVSVFLSVHPHADEVLVPKLLIQTFIENSVKYGMREGLNLEIDVDVKLYGSGNDQFVQFRISDNGKGFEESYLTDTRENGFNDKTGRIGLSNLYNRLKLLYPEGNTYLTIYNNENGGATAEVILPAVFNGGTGKDANQSECIVGR